MNASINRFLLLDNLRDANDAAKWRAHVAAMATQPQVDATLTLLASGYDQGGLLLDLYGTNSKSGIEVEDVALRGSKVSLAEQFSNKQMEDMGYWCERQAIRESRRDARDNAIDRAYLAMYA
jgi:hypothetical protein